jgi:hypothetical protein
MIKKDLDDSSLSTGIDTGFGPHLYCMHECSGPGFGIILPDDDWLGRA